MKIRNGYVSNSSSSSYLIAIGVPKEEYIEEIRKIILQHYSEEYFKKAENNGKETITAFDGRTLSIDVKTGDYVMRINEYGTVELDCDGEIISEVQFEDFNPLIVGEILSPWKFKAIETIIGQGRDG